MYRMSSTLFNKIVNNILSYDVELIPEYFTYFKPCYDATGRLSTGPILKCTSAISQLAYDTAPDAFDEYLQIVERTSRECLDNFTKCIHVLYVEMFLRKTIAADIQKTYQLHEQKHGLPGMLESIDSPECLFVVNEHTYRKGYYLADGIYPAWSTFVKMFLVARDEKSLKFKRVQEAARKDIERAFGVWGIIRQLARPYQINMLKRSSAIGERPAEVTDDSKWDEMDENAIINLHLALVDGVLSSIKKKKIAKDIWDHLARLYEARSLHNKKLLKRKLYALRMTESNSMTEHVNNLNTLFSQLTSLSCKIQPQERVEILLQSLPNSYDQVIINLTSNVLSDNLVFVDVATAILEEENRHNYKEGIREGELIVKLQALHASIVAMASMAELKRL
uniref:Gag-Pol polyprotein n=1 Tax=Tanacetum cinerariifolium TaxID=118510 RepID=A0A6L2LW71_TANCI|nr:Gag-Pol polyprotein [Tanacetum cinerariifolium]